MEGLKTMLQYENIRRSQMGGIELIARWRICRGLFLRGNYNYLFQIDDASQESTQYIYPSPHTATLQADYGFSAGNNCYINFNATLRYVGAKTYEDFMPIIDLSGMSSGSMADLKYWTGSYSARQEGYVICDAAINFDFKEMVGISVGVDNIGNYRPKIVNFNSATTPPVSYTHLDVYKRQTHNFDGHISPFRWQPHIAIEQKQHPNKPSPPPATAS